MNFKAFTYCIITQVFLMCVAITALAQNQGIDQACYDALHAQNPDPNSIKIACPNRLKTVVVSASRTEQELLAAPAAVTILTAEDIQHSGANSVADLLKDVPGIELSDAGEVGLKRIRIRGEESRRIALFIDGQEFIDPREVGTPFLIAPEQIERLEVLRGPASVLYGSRAIGGVVNIITKKGGFHKHQGFLSGQYNTATDGFQNAASVFGASKGWEYRLLASKADHGNRESPDGDIDNTSFDNDSLSAFLAKTFGVNRLAFGYEVYNASTKVFVDPIVATTPPLLDFRINAPERDREKFWTSYDLTSQEKLFKKLHLDLYSQNNDRRFDTFSDTSISTPIVGISNTAIYSSALLKTLGGNLQIDMAPNEAHLLITGLQIIKDEMNQDRRREVQINSVPRPTELVHDRIEQTRWGLFIQDEWLLNSVFSTTIGLRSDWVESSLTDTTRSGLTPNSTNDSKLTASTALTFRPTDDSSLWFRWAQGFVQPSPIQLGTGAFAGPSFVNPNLNLNPETSHSFELGGRLFKNTWNLDGAVFLTKSKNYIDHVLCSSTFENCIQPTGTRDRVYVNLGEALTFGSEITASYDFGAAKPYGNLTVLRRRYQRSDGIETYKTGLPKVAAKLGFKYEKAINNQVAAWLDANIRSESDSSELANSNTETQKPGWASLNLSLGLDIGSKKRHKVILELSNITDKRYTTSTENVLAEGRSAMIKLILGL